MQAKGLAVLTFFVSAFLLLRITARTKAHTY
jgi:hypothetical protein